LPAGWRALVVDNGSRDGSAEVALAHGATLVVEPRRGFGSACAAGLSAASAQTVAFCDADGSLDLRDLPRIVAPVAAGAADLVLGRRVPTARSAWPVHSRVANRYLARQVRRRPDAADRRRTDARRPREALVALGVRDRRSGYPLETVLLAAGAGWRIAEVPVPYRPRTGRSKVTGTVRGTLRAVADMRRALREVDA
jgi:glycosyltransferase involved in cell wall biosynthesis